MIDTGMLRATLFGGLAALVVLGSAPAFAQAVDPNRINTLEGQVRALTGQVEDLTHQIQVLQDTLRRLQEDTEYRFGELEGGTAKKPAAAQAMAPAAAQATAPGPAPGPAQQGVIADQQLGAPPKALGQVVVDAPAGSGAQPLDLSSLAGPDQTPADAGQAPPADIAQPAPGPGQTAMVQPNAGPAPQDTVPAPTGDPRADYDAAYKLFAANRYDAAEQAFRQYLDQYPLDPRAAEAQYWIGLSLFVRGDYQRSAEQFLASYKQYPKGRFVVESLFQLGQSQAGLGRPDEACKSYAVALKQYPQMANALKQRIVNAKATAGC